MKKSSIVLVLALVAAFAAKAHAAKEGVFINTGDLKWGDAPPVLPKGAKIAVLNGDPFKPGQYTLRLSLPANYKLPPHWHTLTENLTIVSGTFYIGMGDKAVAKDAHEVKTGGPPLFAGEATPLRVHEVRDGGAGERRGSVRHQLYRSEGQPRGREIAGRTSGGAPRPSRSTAGRTALLPADDARRCAPSARGRLASESRP